MKKFTLFIVSILLGLGTAAGQVVPTNEWVSFWSDSSRINNNAIPVGSVIRAYDPQGVLCGEFNVTTPGSYGLMSVYMDDPTTPLVDEGAVPGDTIHFTINGLPATPHGPKVPIWSANGDVEKVNLVVEEPEIQTNPVSVSFGTVPLKSSVSQSLTIKNTGLKPMTIDSIRVVYHFPDFFSLSVHSTTLAPGASVLVNVGFSPALGSGNIDTHVEIYSNAWNASILSVPLTATIKPDVAPTNEWVSFWSDTTTFHTQKVSPGDVIDAYSPQGVHCGTFTVTSPGSYGLMSVYKDDPTTPTIDEGAAPGDTIHFTINGQPAAPRGPRVPVWTANGDVEKVNLAVEGPIIQTNPDSVSFGTVFLKTSASKSLVVMNVGLKPLVIDSMRIAYHFPDYFTLSLHSATLDSGASVLLNVGFSPMLGSGSVSTNLEIFSNASNAPLFTIPVTATTKSDVMPTNQWVSFWGDTVTLDGHPVVAGDVVDAYDPQGVHCGTFTVSESGSYGFMSVYMDDPTTTTVDEGASTGDSIRFTINGHHASPKGPSRPLWTSNGAVLKVNLSGSTLPAPVLLSPANGATGILNGVSLTWNASTGATSYRVQVSADSTFGMAVIDTSGVVITSLATSGLSPNTKYFWRVDASNAIGTSDWSTVWNITTVAAVPPVPVQASPANGITGISVSPALKWYSSPGATTYNLQVSSDARFSSTVLDSSGISDTLCSLNGLNHLTLYYWRVDASNAGGTSSWSSAWSFTTVLAAPTTPLLLSPPNGAQNQRTDTLVLKWSRSVNADGYHCQLDTNSSFSHFIVNDSTSDTTRKVVSLSNLRKYYWRVSAYNAGGESGFATADSFTTIVAVPAAPVLVSPVNLINVARKTTFTWHSSTHATQYHLQVASDLAFTTVVRDTSQVTDTTLTLSVPLDDSASYFWRVSAIDIAGEGPYSSIAHFTTGHTTSVDDALSSIPTELNLSQNYPNPFNPSTTIRYDIPQLAYVKLAVYDILGREVASLVSESQNAGHYNVVFNAGNLPSGVYFYSLQAGDKGFVKKLLLVK